jgi:hypothetical protein
MKHYRFMAWLWLVLGAFATVYKCWHAVAMGDFIYSVAGSSGLAWEIGECVVAVAVAAAGHGLVRGWPWARVAVELLASVLLGICGLILVFGDIALSPASLAPVIFALYSLTVVLFFRYEPRRA